MANKQTNGTNGIPKGAPKRAKRRAEKAKAQGFSSRVRKVRTKQGFVPAAAAHTEQVRRYTQRFDASVIRPRTGETWEILNTNPAEKGGLTFVKYTHKATNVDRYGFVDLRGVSR